MYPLTDLRSVLDLCLHFHIKRLPSWMERQFDAEVTPAIHGQFFLLLLSLLLLLITNSPPMTLSWRKPEGMSGWDMCPHECAGDVQ